MSKAETPVASGICTICGREADLKKYPSGYCPHCNTKSLKKLKKSGE